MKLVAELLKDVRIPCASTFIVGHGLDYRLEFLVLALVVRLQSHCHHYLHDVWKSQLVTGPSAVSQGK